jgi:hypothetical protein
METKLYKVYANCVTTTNPIQEIDDADQLEAIDELIDYNLQYIDYDDDDFEKIYNRLYDEAIYILTTYEYLECGDYCLVYDNEIPKRADAYDYEDLRG